MTNPLLMGFLGSLFAGLATLLGFIPLFFISSINKKTESLGIGFSAGVMLAASFFSLLIPACEKATQCFDWKITAVSIVILGFALGIFFIWWVDLKLASDPLKLFEGGKSENTRSFVRSLWLFIIAITIHNFPEGMAVGLALGNGDLGFGMPLAVGIAIQNMPEGLVVALAVVALGHSRWRAFIITLISGLMEPVGGLFGVFMAQLSDFLLPMGLGFAAGAMCFVIIHKMMPEIQKAGFHEHSTFGSMVGMVVMMALEVLFG